MKNKIPTVTIALSAYNEEQNIVPFLKSVIKQKEDGFIIKTILVISDGSTDNTVKNAQKIKDKRITILPYTKREGKSSRLNYIYKKLKTDYLVQTDSDVIFKDSYVVKNIIAPLMHSKSIAMCGGNPLPLKSETFTEEAINKTVEVYVKFREKVRNGNNIFSVDGRLLAYKNTFVKTLTIPTDMIANDAFTYFECLSQKLSYKYVKSAVVLFRSPQNIRDHIRQNTRFLAAPIRMKKYYDAKLVEDEKHIPKSIFIKELIIQFAKYPIHCSYIIILNRICQIRANLKEQSLTAKWDLAITTKRLKFNI